MNVPADTAGQCLGRQVRELRVRRTPTLGWLAAFGTVRARAADLPTPSTSQRRRVEMAVPDVPHGVEPGPYAWPSPSRLLPTVVREWLRPLVGPGVEQVLVRADDESADELARRHGADAVTVGQEIHLRTGRFRPADPDGFALLAHEAWHATAQQRAGAATARATELGVADEERAAIELERAVLGTWETPAAAATPDAEVWPDRPTHSGSPARTADGTTTTPAHGPAPSPAARPMTAVHGRDLPAPQGESPQTAADLADLSRQLYRDVLRQVKIDMERGG